MFNEKEYYETTFNGHDEQNICIEDTLFESCTFENMNLSQAKFYSCKFIDCEFRSCNLSTVLFDNSSFSDVLFYESKLIGINWTKVKWPQIKLSNPIKIYKSNINHSIFYALELEELMIEECSAVDVDFRSCNLSHANFKSTDLEKSQFMNTNLYCADFTESYNYRIHPADNNIKKAKFSMPDAINLLYNFDINLIE